MAKKNKSARLPADYDRYQLTPAQTAVSIAVVGLASAVVAYIFYMNFIISLIALLFGLLGPRLYRGQLVKKRRKDLNLQFKDFLYALNASVSAGKSIEDGVICAREDIAMLYMSDEGILVRELDNMIVKMQMDSELTVLMSDLGHRSKNEDIQSFATVLENGKAKGINETELIQKTAYVISEKIEVKNEIEVKVASMKMDQLIMLIMPVMIMLLMNTTAPDYMQTLYESPFGYLIVTIGLALILVAVLISNKIMNIKV